MQISVYVHCGNWPEWVPLDLITEECVPPLNHIWPVIRIRSTFFTTTKGLQWSSCLLNKLQTISVPCHLLLLLLSHQSSLFFALSLALTTSCKLLFSFIIILTVLLSGWFSGWWRHSQPCHITRSLVDLFTCSKLHNQTNVLLLSFVFISVLVSQTKNQWAWFLL